MNRSNQNSPFSFPLRNTLLILGFIALVACGGGGGGSTPAAEPAPANAAPATDIYTIGGTVLGLIGSGLVLQNNSGDNLTIGANGNFTFATSLAAGSSYSVSVMTQPANPKQICTVNNSSGTVSSANVTTVQLNCITQTYTIGGKVSELAGSGLVLQNNSGDNLAIGQNGNFVFAAPLEDGSNYSVSILTQPINPDQICNILKSSGTLVGANYNGVIVSCVNAYTIGGTVFGLQGSGLILRNNGGNDLPITADGAFTFSVPIGAGVRSEVSIFSQPTKPAQSCNVRNGDTVVSSTNVTNVRVTCTRWEWSNPLPQGYGLNAAAWTGSKIVAVGQSGVIMTSLDGANWFIEQTGITKDLTDITWTGSQLVVVGSSGVVYTSIDGSNWTLQVSTTKQRLNAVTWTGSKIVAVGINVTITSLDGSNWISPPSGVNSRFIDVTWTGQELVAVDEVTSVFASKDGSNWNERATNIIVNPNIVNRLSAITWTGTQLVAVGSRGSIFTSPDGVTWTKQISNVTWDLNAITWTGSQLVVVGDLNILTSPDGVSWAERGTGSFLANGVVQAGSQLVAVGEFGLITTSVDGSNWGIQGSNKIDRFNDIVWTGSQLVAVGDRGNIMTSPDGVSWTKQISNVTWDLNAITWTGSQLVSVGSGVIVTSPDGVSWTRTSANFGILDSVIWTGSQLVAVGTSGAIVTSKDGISWMSQITGASGQFESIAWTGSQLVTVGTDNGNVYTSTDGVTWAVQTSSINQAIHSIVWTGSQLVAVGGFGSVFTSLDGKNWTAQTSGTYEELTSITWTGSELITAGYNGAVLTSIDGINWESISYSGIEFRGVAWTGARRVVVGRGGAILTNK